jgi:hypothetical protein
MCLGIYLVEAGLLLIVAPWTEWWRRNYFAYLHPWLSVAMGTAAVRTLMVIAGIVTVVAGMIELRLALARRMSGSSRSGRAPDA